MSLNIVIHKSMLEDEEKEPSAIPGEQEEALRALARIRRVHQENPENIIYFEGYKWDELPSLCGDRQPIVLYGCCRDSCLLEATIVLSETGYQVAYDIEGTTF